MPCISPVRTLLPILLIALPTHSVSSPFQALPAESSLLTVAAVGDIMMGSIYPESAALPLDPEGFLRPFEPTLRSAEMVFANLEGPLLEGGTTSKCSRLPAASAASFNCFAFRVPPLFGGVLRQAGFNVVSLANNHAGDFGEQGRSSTRAVLDQLGIRHVGSSREKYAATLMEVRGKRIGLIGFAHNDVSPNINDVESARDLVAKLKQKSDLVIVSFHGGGEGAAHQHVPLGTECFLGESRGDLRALTHTVIDAGADLVLGHGPHVLRGMEFYRRRLIVYSMGNFFTYGQFTLKGPTALTAIFLLQLAPDGSFLQGRIVPGRQVDPGGPVPDTGGTSIRTIQQLSEADFGRNSPLIAPDGSFRARPEVTEPLLHTATLLDSRSEPAPRVRSPHCRRSPCSRDF